MTLHDRNGGGLPPEDEDERKTLKSMGDDILHQQGDWRPTYEQCRKSNKVRLAYDRKSRDALNAHLALILAVICVAAAHRSLRKRLEKKATALGISRPTKATSLALLAVKVLTKNTLQPATASLWAKALRAAGQQGIAPDDLPNYLRENGGYVALAKSFKASSGQGATPTTTAATTPAKSDSPRLTWRAKGAMVWDQAVREKRSVKLTVKPNGTDSGTVIRARISSRRKRIEARHDS